MGQLKLLRGDGTSIEWHATSGIPRNQGQEHCWKRNAGVIPASVLVQDPYMVSTECIMSRLVSSVGKWLHAITPFTVWSKDGSQKRTNVALHHDANHATSPGSGGCIVFVNIVFWEQFMAEMKLLRDAGIASILLEVEYI